MTQHFLYITAKKLIKYACLDCVSVAYINLIMQQSKIPLDPNYVQQEQQISGAYNLSKDLSVVSDIFQLNEDSSSSVEQYNTELVTVHVPDERHQFKYLTIQMDYHNKDNETTAIIPKASLRSHTRSSIAKEKTKSKN